MRNQSTMSDLKLEEKSVLLWGTYDEDKQSISDEFDNFQWNQESGLSAEALEAECHKIILENQGASRMTIKSKMMAFVLEHAQVGVNPNDWFADRINHANIIERIRDSWEQEIDQLLGEKLALSAIHEKSEIYEADMNFSHTSADWHAVMDLGIPGLLERVRKIRSDDETPEQRDFYDAVERVYCAALVYIERLAKEAEALQDTYPKMEIVACTLRNLTKGAPSTFLEAMQLTTLFYTVQNDVEKTGMRTWGGLDNLYYRYYKADLESGRYTEVQLRELIDYFYYRIYARKVISNIPFYLGGRDENGKDMLNELSYVLLEEYRKVMLPDPKIQIKVHKDIPEDFLELVFTCIREGASSFCLINDDMAVKALENLGESTEDAKGYTIIGCYEPCAEGKEVPCTSAVYLNMAKAFEIAIHNGYDPVACQEVAPAGSDEDFSSFENFDAYWKRLLKIFVEESMMVTNEREKHYSDIHPCPFFSGSLAPCVESGKDAYAGGAKYNNTSIPMYGIATIVDSLLAIKKVVFEKKLLSFEEFATVLSDNWRGHEELRSAILADPQKYGNNDPEADKLMVEIVEYITALINKKPNGRGGVWRCGLFSITYHEIHGAKVGATPDGRLAGEPVSKNTCAVVGKDMQGPTALINSVCKIDYSQTPDGSVLDVVIHKTAAEGKEGLAAMIGLMKTYFAKGGFSFNLNVFDPSVLREAQKDPEKYSTLQVRLCGWNEYFVTLTKTLQDEFIAQTEHSLKVM